MKVLVLNEHDVRAMLTWPECIAAMEAGLTALARGEVHNPLRQKVHAPEAPGLLGLMPVWRGGATPYYALKEVCVFPRNPERGLDTHLGAVILHDGETGEPLAFMNAAAITAIRTAAVSALATRLLAREDASVLAILGAGVQAESHLAAIATVRTPKEVRIFSRTREKAERLAGSEHRVTGTAEEAVQGADVIVTATSSREPVLRGEWLRPGMHINAVGSSIPSARELDGSAVARSSLFVDRRESTIHESGDYLDAVGEGAIEGPGHIRAELGEILLGTARGRTSPEEITLFKSLGLAVEDLSAAAVLYDASRKLGRGVWVEF